MKKEYYLYKYVYSDTIIYIGKTDSSLEARIRCHSNEAKFYPYLKESKIFCMKLKNSTETKHLEALLINKYKPILNCTDKHQQSIAIEIKEPEWISYEVYKELNEELNEKTLDNEKNASNKKRLNHVLGRAKIKYGTFLRRFEERNLIKKDIELLYQFIAFAKENLDKVCDKEEIEFSVIFDYLKPHSMVNPTYRQDNVNHGCCWSWSAETVKGEKRDDWKSLYTWSFRNSDLKNLILYGENYILFYENEYRARFESARQGVLDMLSEYTDEISERNIDIDKMFPMLKQNNLLSDFKANYPSKHSL